MRAKKSLLMFVFGLMSIALNAENFVDLGLPSGTLWKNQNEQGYYSHYDAVSNFGNQIPSKEQWMELVNECDWSWTGMGYRIVGPNGNRITISAEGHKTSNGKIEEMGVFGKYWSSFVIGYEQDSYDRAWCFSFANGGVSWYTPARFLGMSIRLVKNQ